MNRFDRLVRHRKLPASIAGVVLQAAAARRSIRANGFQLTQVVGAVDERPVFVIGSPRSGTSFIAGRMGGMTGFTDLGELGAFKRMIPSLAEQVPEGGARHIRRTIRIAQRMGAVRGMRGIEQTPESAFVLPAIALAYPDARYVHMVRDGRDVAASLVGLGWLRDEDEGRVDDAGQPFGAHARFWVEPRRRADFAEQSDARRAGLAWVTYETAARRHQDAHPEQVHELRYEHLVEAPGEAAHELCAFLGCPEREAELVELLGETRSNARGRWLADLTSRQVDDVLAEAGPLLAELGYT